MSENVQQRLSIFVNGHAQQVGATTELNRETLLRDEWPARTLQHGDRVEFIRVVAGG
jgi:thiamine biosynthesis protein ThiS